MDNVQCESLRVYVVIDLESEGQVDAWGRRLQAHGPRAPGPGVCESLRVYVVIDLESEGQVDAWFDADRAVEVCERLNRRSPKHAVWYCDAAQNDWACDVATLNQLLEL